MIDFKCYISIARPDHWFKNVLIVPGIVIATMLTKPNVSDILVPLLLGFISTCLVASANYVINEWLDMETDKFHPVKKNRPCVAHKLNGYAVSMEYVLLAVVGLTMAWFVSFCFFIMALSLLIMGIIYNVKPLRTKDRVFLDVISESINNPIRLLLGWFIVTGNTIPPASFLFAYWLGGAFLMNTKRYAEYKYINNPEIAHNYRKSFQFYTEQSLLLISFFYAICCAFFLGIFLIKHRIELLVSLPFIAILFAWYLYIGMKPDSNAQKPEKLYRETRFMLYSLFLVALIGLLLFVDIPPIHFLLENTFISK